MNEYEWVAWQALSDLVRIIMVSTWIWFGYLAFKVMKKNTRGGHN
jgi:hypothetical protein